MGFNSGFKGLIWQNFGILQLGDPSFMKSFDVRGGEGVA